jgi:hypothetical protein
MKNNGAATIVADLDHYQLKEWKGKGQVGLGPLFATGVLG